MTTNCIGQLMMLPCVMGVWTWKFSVILMTIPDLQGHFLIFYLKPVDKGIIGFLRPDGSIHPGAMPALPDWKLEDINKLSQALASEVPSNQYSAAEIQNYHLHCRNDPRLAVKNMGEWTRLQGRYLNLDFTRIVVL